MKSINSSPYALCLSDLHAGKDNLDAFTANWNEALEVCKERGIKNVIVNGDLFQSRAGQTLDVLMAVHQALKNAEQLNIMVFLANGNHDKVNQESYDGYCNIFEGCPNVVVIPNTMVIGQIGLSIHIISYFPETGSFMERLKNISDNLNPGKYNILCCHEGISGGLTQPRNDEVPASCFEGFDKVLVGHYHDAKIVEGTNIEYTGASRQHNFGEDIKKGYTIIYLDGSTESVQNKVNTRYHTVNVSSVEEAKEAIKRFDLSKDKVRVRLSAPKEVCETVNRQELIELGASKVECESTTAIKLSDQADFTAKFDKANIKSEYSKFCSQKSISDPELGIHYLDKIN